MSPGVETQESRRSGPLLNIWARSNSADDVTEINSVNAKNFPKKLGNNQICFFRPTVRRRRRRMRLGFRFRSRNRNEFSKRFVRNLYFLFSNSSGIGWRNFFLSQTDSFRKDVTAVGLVHIEVFLRKCTLWWNLSILMGWKTFLLVLILGLCR